MSGLLLTASVIEITKFWAFWACPPGLLAMVGKDTGSSLGCVLLQGKLSCSCWSPPTTPSYPSLASSHNRNHPLVVLWGPDTQLITHFAFTEMSRLWFVKTLQFVVATKVLLPSLAVWVNTCLTKWIQSKSFACYCESAKQSWDFSSRAELASLHGENTVLRCVIACQCSICYAACVLRSNPATAGRTASNPAIASSQQLEKLQLQKLSSRARLFWAAALACGPSKVLLLIVFLSSAAGVGLNTKPFPTVLLPAWKTYQCPVKRQIRPTEEVWELMSPQFAEGWRQRENKWLARGRAGGKPLALAGLFASQFSVIAWACSSSKNLVFLLIWCKGRINTA